MRRLIAYLVLAVSILLAIGFNIGPALKSTHSGLDYDSGREFVYRITDPANEEAVIKDDELDKLASIMEKRLERAGVTRYNVQVEGNDQIRVIVSQKTNTQYAHIQQLMAFDGTFELWTTNETEYATATDIFKNSVARIDFKVGSPLPYVVIPISNKQKVENLRKAASALDTSGGEEEQASQASQLILWADKAEGDTYEFAMGSEEGADKVKAKMLMAFDPGSMYFTEAQNEISVRISIDANNDQQIDDSEVANSVETAQQYVGLLNAGSLDYDVKFLFNEPTSPRVEAFIKYGTITTIAGSDTIFAMSLALIFIGICICLYYRLGGATAMVGLLSTIYATFLIFNSIGMEFNVAALLGLICGVMVNVLASVIYNEKLKEEVYRGRSLKKANSEALKKTLGRIVDIHVILLLLSGITYFLGKGMISSFAVMGVISTAISFVVSLTINRLMMWLITNDTSLQNKQNCFGIRKDRIPDLKKEEKQQYFGPLADKDFTVKAKKNGLVASLITLAAVISVLAIGLIGGQIFARDVAKNSTRVYFEIHQYSENVDTVTFDTITTQFETLKIDVSNIEKYETIDDNDEKLYYFVVDLKNLANEETLVGANKDIKLEDALASMITGVDTKDTVMIRQNRTLGDQPAMNNIILCVAISSLAGIIYVAIRYNLARGIATLVVTSASTVLTIAFFSITRIPVISPTILSVFGVALISMLISAIMAHKQSEMAKEAKIAGLDKKTTSIRALAISATAVIAICFITGFVALNFLAIGPETYMTTFAGLLIGTALALTFALLFFVPIQNAIMKVFTSRKRVKEKEERKLGNIKASRSSAEPEESIFIGIND